MQTVADAEEILELQKLAYQSEAALYAGWSIPPLTQTLAEMKKEFIETIFLKVYDSGRLIGSVRASTHDGICEIGRLIVHPAFQQRGWGLFSAVNMLKYKDHRLIFQRHPA